MAYPTTLSSLTNPSATDNTVTVSHSSQHSTANDCIEAIETKLGVDSSAVTSTIDYKLKNAASINPGHKHSLAAGISDVTITTPVSGNGLFYNGSAWVNTDTSVADSSTTVKGVTKLSVAPVSASIPIAVGDNDSRVPTADPTTLFIAILPGMISPYAGASAPSGWLLANGATVSQSTYAALYAVTGHTFGADPGSGNFILPDLRGRVPVGIDATADFDVRGETGGVKTVTLTAAQSALPAHTHNEEYMTAGSGGGGIGGVLNNTTPTGSANSTGSTTQANAAEAHTNLQPYIALNYIIKY